MLNNSEKDIILFNEIKRNNQKAFDELFTAYYNELCDFSYLLINNKPLAEEIVADVFANLWIKRKKIKILKNVKAYLYSSTRNLTISYIRKNKNHFEQIEEERLNIVKSEFSPEKNIKKQELTSEINYLLSVIPERSREIFVLHRFNNFRYSDIADFLEISVKTVEKHMSKALRIMRDAYRKNNLL